MAQEVQVVLQSIASSIRQRNGVNLARFMQVTGEPRSMLLNIAPRLRSVDIQSLVGNFIQDQHFGTMVAGALYAAASLTARDYEEAYRHITSSYSALVDFFSNKDENTNWIIPLLRTSARDLKNTAILADQISKDMKTLRDTANHLTRGFTAVARDRTQVNQPQAKKHAIFVVTNALFQLYFKMNTLQLCVKLINTVEGSGSGSITEYLSYFPVQDVVMYKYYVGRLKMFEDKYDEARECLRFALQHTPPRQVRNRQRILACLVPIEMTMGVMPGPIIAQQYNFEEYYQIGLAVKAGNIGAFNEVLEANRVAFIHHGVYLVLENVRALVYRSLFRRIYLITNNTRINLYHLQLSLEIQNENISIEEIECIVASLIYQNRIKGYISHEKKFLIVSKTDPFPLSAVVVRPGP